MLSVNFFTLDHYNKGKGILEVKLKFVVIMARYQSKWIIVRHRERITWEIPGGHIESGEKVENAAYRELYEETGAKSVELHPVSVYSVNDGERETFGQLFFAEVNELGQLPVSEIEEIKLVDNLPNELTYPLIQPFLFNRVIEYLENK